ncbi:MAG: hypothetical protein ACXQS2_00135 [Methermicoccaceae archaeon]
MNPNSSTKDNETLKERLLSLLSEEEVKRRVDEKIRMLGGLCDEDTAMMLLAHEVGVNTTTITTLPDNGWVAVDGCVLSILSLRTFTKKDGSEGLVANLQIGDENSRMRVVLWDEVAELVRDGVIEERKSYRFSGAMRGDELHLGRGSNITPLAEQLDPNHEPVPIGELHTYQDGAMVDVKGVVIATSAVLTRGERRYREVALWEDGACVLLTLWDRMTEVELFNGDVLEIHDAYLSNKNGVKLHARGGVYTAEHIDVPVEDTQKVSEVLNSLHGGGNGELVSVLGVLTGVDPERVFERKDGSTGRLQGVYLSDPDNPSARVRVVLWDGCTSLLDSVELGQYVLIRFCIPSDNELFSTAITSLDVQEDVPLSL